MNALQGAVKNGQIVLNEPAELPEGSRVEELPVEAARPTLGLCEEDWTTAPEGIAALFGADGSGRAGVALTGIRRRVACGLTRRRTSRRPASLRTPMH